MIVGTTERLLLRSPQCGETTTATMRAPLPPGDAKPSLYTFKGVSASGSGDDKHNDTYCAPTGTNFKTFVCGPPIATIVFGINRFLPFLCQSGEILYRR
jgi:hypothetical protein